MIWILIWIVCGMAGAALLSRNNSSGLGCVLGLLLGPIGVIIALVMRETGGRRCPHCREHVHQDATVCPHCQRDLVAPPAQA